MKEWSHTSTPPMGRTTCTESRCLYEGALYLYFSTAVAEIFIRNLSFGSGGLRKVRHSPSASLAQQRWCRASVLFLYTGCPRRKGQNFGRVFLMLKYTDITQNTYIQSWTVTEIMAREKCVLLAGLRTIPCQLTAFPMSVLDCRVILQKYRWRSYVSTPLWPTMHVMYSAWNS